MTPEALSTYQFRFAHLHRNTHPARGHAPHKPIFLLSILHEIDAGRITTNLIAPSAELVAAFRLYWEALVPAGSGRQERMAYPFRYLRQDGFWELVKDGQIIIPESNHDYTLHQLSDLCDGGRFDAPLWELLQDASTRATLRQQIRSTYFDGTAVTVTTAQQTTYLYDQAEKLKRQSQARFVERRVREPRDEGYYVRHRLFPTVIRELYDNACCVCRLSAQMEGCGSVVESAHILPFAEFHNDDPRNGIALCKNHHWGFDCGVWSFTDSHRILVSPRLHSEALYIVANAAIHLPADPHFHPDPAALAWHRQKWGF